jgi:hypothetical protein
MAGNRTVRVKLGSYVHDVELQFQMLKLLCERDLDPYAIVADSKLNTARAVDVLALVTGDEPDTFWQLAVEHRPLTVINAAANVLIAFATAGSPAPRKGKSGSAPGDAPPK